MKKIIKAATLLLVPFAVNAQNGNVYIDHEVFRTCAVIFVVILFMAFFLAIIKWILEHRLKNKIIDKGVSENLVASVLQTTTKQDGNANIKWFAILAGIGAGLTIVNYTLPLGIHSLAIMFFSTAASFLGYYFFVKKTEK
jgi:hypothetical protein